MKTFAIRLLVVALIVGGSGAQASAQGVKSDSVVKITAKAGKLGADGSQEVTLTVKVEKPYHIYANPVANDTLKSVQTTLKFVTNLEGEPKIDYPDGKVIENKDLGNYKTYEGEVTIKANVRRAKGDTAPLELTVKVQACDDSKCLLPATIKVKAE